MNQTVVMFNNQPIPIQFHGSDEKQIPALISALRPSTSTSEAVTKCQLDLKVPQITRTGTFTQPCSVTDRCCY